MCRFAGFIYTDKKEAIEKIRLMNRELSRGGPDDEGIYLEDNLCIGHRRLAIIDLSKNAHQPMVSDNKDFVIAFNGEIYNFKEIRRELEGKGYKFKSNSDTEVILKSFIEWKENSFRRLEGMFAFSIYDKKNKDIYLVRDPLGIKPLYYGINNRGIIFSSEVRGFKTYENLWEEDERWKIYFLIFGFLPEPFTTLKGVFMLPPACYLKYNLIDKSYKIESFFTFKFNDFFKNEKIVIERTREIFEESVKRHLVSDAPIGVFLSGGIDSSLIALLAGKMKRELITLSIIFDEPNYDESYYQEIVKQKLRSRHFPYKVSKSDLKENIDDIMAAMDQPTFDGVNTYFISKCAKDVGLKSVLSGLGGDELFGGYPSFRRIEMLIFLKLLFRQFNLFKEVREDRLKRFSYLDIPNPISYYLSLRSVFTVKEISKLFDIDEKEIRSNIEKVYWDINMKYFGRKNFVSFLEMFYMRNQLLKDSDFMSMWNSVEIRVPFLDFKLFRFISSVDEKIKFKGEKYLLKKSFKDILPEEIVKRRKKGFIFPMKEWLGDFEIQPSQKSVLNRKMLLELEKIKKEGRLHWTKSFCLYILTFLENKKG